LNEKNTIFLMNNIENYFKNETLINCTNYPIYKKCLWKIIFLRYFDNNYLQINEGLYLKINSYLNAVNHIHLSLI